MEERDYLNIEHIAMYVEDLDGARVFFETYFGAISNSGYQNTITGFRSFFLSFEGGSRLELMTRPALETGEKGHCRCGYSHLAFNVGSAERVDSMTKRLLQDGYAVVSGPRTTGDGYYESCVMGFEGNLIEITV